MRHRFYLLLTLTAWLFATGSHWDLVQTFAWGRMIAKYAERMPIADAVATTFSPQTMCPLCHAVAEAKQQQSNDPTAPVLKSPGKILLVCAPVAMAPLAPAPVVTGMLAALPLPTGTGRAPPGTGGRGATG